ncbi:M56 family metallopeptidase [Segeticoccus rhizosphaerae]|uniref:M56 family metallopeptidase n=1 Tax=Segeticoccus rhizosphaerae TaxID=1104777 RepID=UPI0010C000F9|nr:M56 family metallopeptidase [Ornithinicoccus soli]
MIVAGLVLIAVVLAGPAPRWLPRATALRRVPRAGLTLWQCVSLSAVVAGLAAGPMAVAGSDRLEDHHPWAHDLLTVLGVAVSVGMLVRILLSGHQVGRSLRAARRGHRDLVDVLGLATTASSNLPASVRVLEHPTPTAYCVPGLRHRVVLSQGTIDALSSDELEAVLSHERAHLRARHDLILEFFTVLHTAVPEILRSRAGLTEVHLLVEVLADRAAARAVGESALARALVTLATGGHPRAALGSGGGTTRTRLELLGQRPAGALCSAGVYLLATAVLAAPVVLIAFGLLGRG